MKILHRCSIRYSHDKAFDHKWLNLTYEPSDKANENRWLDAKHVRQWVPTSSILHDRQRHEQTFKWFCWDCYPRPMLHVDVRCCCIIANSFRISAGLKFTIRMMAPLPQVSWNEPINVLSASALPPDSSDQVDEERGMAWSRSAATSLKSRKVPSARAAFMFMGMKGKTLWMKKQPISSLNIWAPCSQTLKKPQMKTLLSKHLRVTQL